jgi:hypothetical protein
MLATSKESQNNLINILVDRKVLDPTEVSKTKSELKENNQLDKISLIDALLNKNIISEDKILNIRLVSSIFMTYKFLMKHMRYCSCYHMDT